MRKIRITDQIVKQIIAVMLTVMLVVPIPVSAASDPAESVDDTTGSPLKTRKMKTQRSLKRRSYLSLL